MTRFLQFLICALTLAGGMPAHGQNGATLLESIDAVKRVRLADAKPGQFHVVMQGIIVSAGPVPQRFVVHDGKSSMVVIAPAPMPDLRMGQEVNLEGYVSSYVLSGRQFHMIAATSVKAGDLKPLPVPATAGFGELNAFNRRDQWVSTEGYVVSWRRSDTTFTVKLASKEGWLTAVLSVPRLAKRPENFHGARLRLTGINTQQNNVGESLQVDTMANVEVLEPGTEDPFAAPLVSMKDVSMRRVTLGKRLRIRGTHITLMEGRKLIVQGDGETAAYVVADPRVPGAADTEFGDGGGLPALRAGDEVEIVGSAIDQSTFAMKTYGMVDCYVRVAGKGRVPEPQRVTIDEFLKYRNEGRWITFEGVIHAWMLQPNAMTYSVGDEQTWTYVSVRSPDLRTFPKDLFGARLRFTGMASGLALNFRGAEMIVPDPSFVEIVRPGKESPFDAPEYTAADISNRRIPNGEPVKTKGLLVGREPSVLYVRGEGASICVSLQAPWARPGNPPGIAFADCGPLPGLKVGDEVEVSGHRLPSSRYAAYDLASASVRITGHQDKVVPVDTTLERIAAGEHTCDLVQVRARLLTIQVAPTEKNQWRTTMLLKDRGKRLTVVHQSSVLHPFDTLKADDDVLLQGVVDRATPESPRQLWLFSPADAKSLGVSKDLLAKNLWIAGGTALSLLALFSGWIVALRRSNRMKSEVASLLEAKVNERTAELRQTQADLSKALDQERKALDQERELNELKTRFVSMVSHEFRTPLGVTMSAVEIMRQFDERLTAGKRRELCDEIYNSTVNMAGLMEQVLLLGRVEAGKLGYNPQPLDIDGFVRRLVDESLSATNRKCPISWKPDGDLTNAKGDESLLRHILSNLITNGAKYSPDGSEVMVKAHRDRMDVVFEVIDRGIGIPDKDLLHLFEAFHRGGNVGNIAGTGLGLVIVKRCIELHRGIITVKSEVGRGTTFTVRIPVFEEVPRP